MPNQLPMPAPKTVLQIVDLIEKATGKMGDADTLRFLDDLSEHIELMRSVVSDGELPEPEDGDFPVDMPEDRPDAKL